MDEPPRRRRRPRRERQRSIPMWPILALVVAGGFAIGAAISLFAHRGADTVALPPGASGPVARVTLAPRPPDTPVPTFEPTPAPEPTLTPIPTASPSAHPSPRPSPRPSTIASAAASEAAQSPTPVASSPSPRALETVAATASPQTKVQPATSKPVAPTAKPVPPTPKAVAASPKPAAPAETADSDFARLSANVVRAYLSALARGDDSAAEAALDAPAGSRASALSEKEFAGPDMRITNLAAHGTDDSARVDVDVQTPHGAYFAQFFVKKSPSGAALIVNHDFIKP